MDNCGIVDLWIDFTFSSSSTVLPNPSTTLGRELCCLIVFDLDPSKIISPLHRLRSFRCCSSIFRFCVLVTFPHVILQTLTICPKTIYPTRRKRTCRFWYCSCSTKSWFGSVCSALVALRHRTTWSQFKANWAYHQIIWKYRRCTSTWFALSRGSFWRRASRYLIAWHAKHYPWCRTSSAPTAIGCSPSELLHVPINPTATASHLASTNWCFWTSWPVVPYA